VSRKIAECGGQRQKRPQGRSWPGIGYDNIGDVDHSPELTRAIRDSRSSTDVTVHMIGKPRFDGIRLESSG
jgi:hypothetical protein